MKKIFLSCLVILSLPLSFVRAQDSFSFQEHLLLLPDLEYESLDYANLENVRSSSEYPLIRWIESQTGKMGRSILMMPKLFDASLQENIIAITSASYRLPGEKLIYFDQQPSPDQMHQHLTDMRRAGVSVAGNASKIDDPEAKGRFVYKVPLEKGDRFSIVSSLDLDKLIRDAQETGYFRETGQKNGENPIYSLKVDFPGGTMEFQAVKITEETLLVFGSRDSLIFIEETLTGEAPSIKENVSFAPAWDAVADFTPLFRIQTRSKSSLEMAMARIENNSSLDLAQKKNQKEQLLSAFPQFQINGIQVDKEVMLRSIVIQHSPEHAKKMEEAMRFRFSSASSGENEVEGFEKVKEKIKLSREGNIVYVSLPIDLELARVQIKLTREHLAKIEAEKAERQKLREAGKGKEK